MGRQLDIMGSSAEREMIRYTTFKHCFLTRGVILDLYVPAALFIIYIPLVLVWLTEATIVVHFGPHNTGHLEVMMTQCFMLGPEDAGRCLEFWMLFHAVTLQRNNIKITVLCCVGVTLHSQSAPLSP